MGAAAMRNGMNGTPARQGKRGKERFESVSRAATNIADADDPAYPAAAVASVPITLLVTLLGAGKTTGVDWDHLNPPAAGGKPQKQGITFIEATLKHTLENTPWTSGTASQQLRETLENLCEGCKPTPTQRVSC